MLQIKSIASNMTEVRTDSLTVLVSYSTPVAVWMNGKFYRTEKKWSVTTSRHINKWLDGYTAEVRPQEFFDSLLDSPTMHQNTHAA